MKIFWKAPGNCCNQPTAWGKNFLQSIAWSLKNPSKHYAKQNQHTALVEAYHTDAKHAVHTSKQVAVQEVIQACLHTKTAASLVKDCFRH
jgi:hypothetical protein